MDKHVAKPFIEAVKGLDTKDLYNDLYWKEVDTRLLDFYSQPFEIEMLVNPVPEKINHDAPMEGVEVHKGQTWQEAEEKRLFTEWEITRRKERCIWAKHSRHDKARVFFKNDNGYWILAGFGSQLTLNQFIDYANIELYWNKPLEELINTYQQEIV